MNIKIVTGIYEQCAELWAEYFYRYHFESDRQENCTIIFCTMELLFKKRKKFKKFSQKNKKVTSIRINNYSYVFLPPISFKSVVISRFHHSFRCYLHNFLYISYRLSHIYPTHPLVIAIQTVSSNGRSEDFLASRIFGWKFRELFLGAVYRGVHVHCSECS